MDRSNTPVSIDQLKSQERGYRRQVDHEPLDMCARANLAWCLFLQAMHQAGRENVLDLMPDRGEDSRISADGGFRLDRNAKHLLRECLVEMRTVYELSRDPREHADVDRLRQLVTISGAEAALREADQEAALWLAEMAQAIVDAQPAVRNHRRRRIPRNQ